MRHLTLLLSIFLLSNLALSQPLWMRYPAISPDGSQIAFSYKGDIFLVPVSGGQAVPITIDESYESMPVWSSDGTKLAYATDKYGNLDIYMHDLNKNETKRLTYHSSNDYPCTFANDDKEVLFNSWRVDLPKYAQFPNSRMPELYSVSTSGGTPKTVLTTPSEAVVLDATGNKIYYQDRKGYEDPFRKHHESSITRDLWFCDKTTQKHTQLTTYIGEDRNPVLSEDNQTLYYLSEESGSFNVHKMDVTNPSSNEQITRLTVHPIRSLSISNAGVMCFGYNGEIYTFNEGQEPKKVNIQINSIRQNLERETVSVSGGITELEISSNGKEFVFVKRGEVFVASVDEGTTKRITNTGNQERSVSFSPDGRSILYAGERDGSWNIYQTKIKNEDEKYFFSSTILEESPVVATKTAEFQPVYSPDGKKVAYLEDRTTLKVIDLKTNQIETVLPAISNYSYSDGDIFYSWSPDSKWIAADMLMPRQWINQVGIINVASKKVTNITKSGYFNGYPRWSKEGNMVYWFSNRDGMKNHGSWGSESDVYAFLLNQEAHELYQLSKEDKELMDEATKDEEKKEDEDKDKDKEDENEVEPIDINFDDLKKRKVRLTLHSSRIGDALVSDDGETLYYLARFEKGIDLWMTKLRTKETKLLTKLGANSASMILGDDKLFVLADGKGYRIDGDKGDKKGLNFNGDMELKKEQELSYMFNHMWQQVSDKFYVKNLHNVDWSGLKENYQEFLPHITNNHDFAEMMSELLGELNASHTGCRYFPGNSTDDQTASLGLFFDTNYTGNGLRIEEVLKDGPCDKASIQLNIGDVLTKINGIMLDGSTNYYDLLNREVGDNVRLTFTSDPKQIEKEIVIQPISRGAEYNLLYERWVANRKKEVEEASGGKVGYVHVRGMNNSSFRTVFDEVLGENYDKESLIVDTRSNGGGWLHDDLATFLSGKAYIQFQPRGQNLGTEPQFKWTKPSVVIIGESNYSDAHMFPYTYNALNIGSTVGMPIPGTGTAVWWERQIDPTIVFGIPQVGMVDLDGDFLENKQFEPDFKVKNSYEKLEKGEDEQLRKAVEVLLSQKSAKPEDVDLDKVEGN